jgi:hypothetical protein
VVSEPGNNFNGLVHQTALIEEEKVVADGEHGAKKRNDGIAGCAKVRDCME